MTKIKIAPSLLGTPLTEQELKSIIGGKVNYTRECYCDVYQYHKVIAASVQMEEPDTEDECKASCKALCDGRSDCSSVATIYMYHS